MQAVAGYELLEPLGRGAHGVVWRARRLGAPSGAPEVAIKRLAEADARAVTRLEREAAVLARLDHPNLVRLVDVVTDGDGVALVVSLARGGSLADRLRAGPLRPDEAVRIVHDVADALASAHRHGLVHGDVKPGNVLLSSEGRGLLADFGVSRWLDAGEGSVPLDPGGPPGTGGSEPHDATGSSAASAASAAAAFAAPEVRAGSAAGPRADVYGLGMVTYTALTGRVPPPASGGRIGADLADEPVSSALARVVAQATTYVAADRFPSAQAFAAALSLVPEASGRLLVRSSVGVTDAGPDRSPGGLERQPVARSTTGCGDTGRDRLEGTSPTGVGLASSGMPASAPPSPPTAAAGEHANENEHEHENENENENQDRRRRSWKPWRWVLGAIVLGGGLGLLIARLTDDHRQGAWAPGFALTAGPAR